MGKTFEKPPPLRAFTISLPSYELKVNDFIF
jgi:hypothetical protein